MKVRALAICLAGLVILASRAIADLPDLGPEWFARLKSSETRLEALWEWEQKQEYAETRERFLAGGSIWVFKCPQKDHPGAYLVLRDGNFHREREKQFGREPEIFPKHAEEHSRERSWRKEMAKREESGLVWKPGEPWLNSVTGFLIDDSGRQLAPKFWIGAGVIADFEGDGFVDTFQVSRFVMKEGGVLDGLSIGPLDKSKPRAHLYYCDFSDHWCWRYGGKLENLQLKKSVVPKVEVRWMMSSVGELDRIRSVPTHPMVPVERRRGSSYGDVPMDKVRMVSGGEVNLKWDFERELGWEWTRMDGSYSRKLAGLFAGMMVRTLRQGEEGEFVDWKQTGAQWLTGDAYKNVPSVLLQGFFDRCGKLEWREFKPQLLSLREKLIAQQNSLPKIERLAEIQRVMPDWMSKCELKKVRLSLLRQERDLKESLVGDPRFELLEALDKTLKQLK